jgi:hypothetical protein
VGSYFPAPYAGVEDGVIIRCTIYRAYVSLTHEDYLYSCSVKPQRERAAGPLERMSSRQAQLRVQHQELQDAGYETL